MKDGYRYFVSHPTGDDGRAVYEGTEPRYYRIPDSGSLSQLVQNYMMGTWHRSSVFPTFTGLLEDLFCGGATVREILDEKDLPQ